MKNKQTAVEWLEELLHFECKYSLNNEVIINYDVLDNIIMKAKKMEKEQIINAWIDGFKSSAEGWNGEMLPYYKDGKEIIAEYKEEYYKETYGK
jgi:uncharacterized Fe-S cluster-containing protein